MTTMVKQSAPYVDAEVNLKFVELMPSITRLALKAFVGYPPDRQAEAIQNTVCWAFQNLKNLATKGRLHDAYAGALTKFAVGRHNSGRTLGTVTKSGDVMSGFCKSLGRVNAVKNYGICENVADTFEGAATASDARYPVHRAIQFKIDFHETWLQQQTPKDQAIIKELAVGSTQSETARKFGVSPACINQYQKRYAKSWSDFISDKKKAA
jgi:hypothetical protein